MNRFKLLFYFFICSFMVKAQISNDASAKIILDKVSASTDALEAIQIAFEYHLYNKVEKINETSQGELILKNDQYILSFMGIEQMSDGENVWTILKEDEEVQISEIDLEDEAELTPSNLLKLYEKGFIYQMGETIGNLQKIVLIPEEVDNVDYFKIELIIDTQLNQIKKLKQYGKNTTESEYIINTFSPSIIDDSSFIFNPNEYQEYDIIDLR